MSEFSDEEIYQEVGKIVESFAILECDTCAKTVMKWLSENGIKGTILRLRTKYEDEDFIISERLERLGIIDSITFTGQHYGVEVRGRVFDNLPKAGMRREDWLKDFHCPSNQFILEEFNEL